MVEESGKRSLELKRKVLERVMGARSVWFFVVRMARVEEGRAEMWAGTRRRRGWARAKGRSIRRVERSRMAKVSEELYSMCKYVRETGVMLA